MSDDTLKSFDARVWAHDFVKTVTENPSIATDEETMTTWFSGALMRGYDEYYWKTPEYKRSIRRALYPWWRRLFI
jgi:hypothetical protein